MCLPNQWKRQEGECEMFVMSRLCQQQNSAKQQLLKISDVIDSFQHPNRAIATSDTLLSVCCCVGCFLFFFLPVCAAACCWLLVVLLLSMYREPHLRTPSMSRSRRSGSIYSEESTGLCVCVCVSLSEKKTFFFFVCCLVP